MAMPLSLASLTLMLLLIDIGKMPPAMKTMGCCTLCRKYNRVDWYREPESIQLL